MYILKNALISIVRNKGRNLLIGIIILVISCATAVTLAINNSSTKLISSYASKYDTEATLAFNRGSMMGNFDPGNRENSKEEMANKYSMANSLSISDVLEYADSSYVKSYYYTASVSINSTNLEKAEASTSSSGNNRFKAPTNSTADFTLTGYSDIAAMSMFVDGTYSIEEGKVFEDFNSDECLINSELALLNEISIGDEITVVDPSDSENTYSLVVVGIYADKEASDGMGMSMFSNSVNNIITNISVIGKLKEGNEELNVSINPTFVLTSSEVVEAFTEELTKKGLNELLTVETNLDTVNGATKTISNVKTFAITFLIITLVIGTVVLLVINMINIRERKYEIGVLRTIGMKKSKVALQFIYELLIVSVVALFLGAVIGRSLSVPISNKLLQNEIEASSTEQTQVKENFGFGNMEHNQGSKFKGVMQIQAFDSIDAVVDLKVLLELLGIGLIITIISGTSAMVSIQRFSPLTILKERT